MGVVARVGASTRRTAVIHAARPAKARARGSTLRAPQQESTSSCHRSPTSTAGCMTVRFILYRSLTRSANHIVSAKWKPVSRKTTSRSGATFRAMSSSTQSWNDDASTSPSP